MGLALAQAILKCPYKAAQASTRHKRMGIYKLGTEEQGLGGTDAGQGIWR
jgi:hypothetical protein